MGHAVGGTLARDRSPWTAAPTGGCAQTVSGTVRAALATQRGSVLAHECRCPVALDRVRPASAFTAYERTRPTSAARPLLMLRARVSVVKDPMVPSSDALSGSGIWDVDQWI